MKLYKNGFTLNDLTYSTDERISEQAHDAIANGSPKHATFKVVLVQVIN